MSTSRAVRVFSGNVTAGATQVVTLPVAKADSIMIAWTITDSGAVGDIGATTVKIWSPGRNQANVEITPVLLESLLPAVPVAAATRVGLLASKTDRYDVRGIEKVDISLTNAAVATRAVAVHVYYYSS